MPSSAARRIDPEPETPVTLANGRGPRLRTAVALLIPLVLLAAVIVLFVRTNGAGLNVTPPAPIETVQFGRTILRPGEIELHLRNTSPEAITLAQRPAQRPGALRVVVARHDGAAPTGGRLVVERIVDGGDRLPAVAGEVERAGQVRRRRIGVDGDEVHRIAHSDRR